MYIRSPAEFYIKYLLVHPDNHSNKSISKILDQLGLDFISDEYVTGLRDRLARPMPFYPKEGTHSPSQRFIIRHGLREIFRPGTDMKIALAILEYPRAKEFVESMLLSHAPPLAIAGAVSRSRGVATTKASIDLFRHYFWNTELLDSTQFRTLLTFRQEGGGASGDEGEDKLSKAQMAMVRASKKAGYLDPRRLAADLPFSPITALMSQMRMGMMPSKMELANVLQQAQVASALKAAEASMYGSDMDSHRAANFAIVAKTMTDILEKVVKPDENLHEDLRKIALRTDPRGLPTIQQLSDGNHTVELQPVKGTHDDATISGGSDEEDGGGEEHPGSDAGLPEGI